MACGGFIPAEFGNQGKQQGSVSAKRVHFQLFCAALPSEVVSELSWLIGEPSALLVIL